MYNQNPYSTFQAGYYQPANYTVPPPPIRRLSDEEYVKMFEGQIRRNLKHQFAQKPKLHEYRDQLRKLAKDIQKLMEQTSVLEENMGTMSETEWVETVDYIKKTQSAINYVLANINKDKTKQAILNRMKARRSRRKRVKLERAQARKEQIKLWEERSRKIDENLQKIKDEDDKLKQEQESKAQADIVLKEVLRKKTDAKKLIAKLDALIKLRRARQNTARGRGEDVSERDAERFNSNIDKLKSLWTQKLSVYDQEESALRAKLKEDNIKTSLTELAERKTLDNLKLWSNWLFGGGMPQRDFSGDIGRFVGVRAQWDRYISDQGTPLPVGWVVPRTSSDSTST